MSTLKIAILALVLLVCGAFAMNGQGATVGQAASPDIVISQVYGGGGNSGATYTNDFIELFNRGTSPVSLAGWSVQYATATGTGNFVATSLGNVTLQPGQYLLVQEAQGAGGTTSLLDPDVVGSINLSGTAGKVALVTTTVSLGCNGGSAPCSPAQLAPIVDLVGYGSANFFEGAAAPTATNTTAVLRASGGCQDTDNNSADFALGAPAPRNTSSPLSPCSPPSATPTPANTPVNTPTPTNTPVATQCQPGYYSDTGNEPCVPAPVGKYVPLAGSTTALPCEAGTYSDRVGAVACAPSPTQTAPDFTATFTPTATGTATIGGSASVTATAAATKTPSAAPTETAGTPTAKPTDPASTVTATSTLASASPAAITPIAPPAGSGSAQTSGANGFWLLLGGLAALAISLVAGIAGRRER